MNEHAAGARAHVPTATHPRCEQFQFSLLDALALTERVDVRIEVHPRRSCCRARQTRGFGSLLVRRRGGTRAMALRAPKNAAIMYTYPGVRLQVGTARAIEGRFRARALPLGGAGRA